MPTYTQDGRPYRLETPLGKDVLLLVRWHGEEFVSRPYQFTVEAWSTDADLDVKKLLLQAVTLSLDLPEQRTPRTLRGIVRRFVNLGPTPHGLTAYHLEIVPPTWMLSVGRGFGVYQDLDVPAILDKVLEGFDVKKELNDPYLPRQYCLRYRESAWAFASRLMEQEGIWYHYNHDPSPPQLVLASGNTSARNQWGLADLRVDSADDMEERLLDAHVVHAPFAGKTVTRTYSEFIIQKELREEAAAAGGSGRFTPPSSLVDYVFDQQLAAHRQGVSVGGSETASDVQKLFEENERNAKLRQEAEETQGLRLFGRSTHRGLTAGAKVSVAGHSAAAVNGAWMVLSVSHRGDNGGYLTDDDDDADYENQFECIPHDVPWRPPRTTPWPQVGGTHVGVVVGPDGEEIFPDKFGRVRVEFRFIGDAVDPAYNACWVRVAQLFAGPTYGSVFLPRIGHEVLVAFLDGNPDNPVIVGQLYSDHNMPPWTLPDNKTQSGVRTKSSLGGGAEDHNELRFEDKKGEEELFVQAQKDHRIIVKNDETRDVRHDRTTTVTNHDTRTVKEGDDTHTVEKGNQLITVTEGNQEVTIGANQTISIGENQTVTIGENCSVTVGADLATSVGGEESHAVSDKQTVDVGADRTTNVGGNDALTVSRALQVEANQKIVLKVGSSQIVIDQTGVTVKGAMIKIEGTGMAEMKSPLTTVKATGILTLQGSLTKIN